MPQYELPPIYYGPSSKVYPMAGANWGHKAFNVPALQDKIGPNPQTIIGIIDTGVDRSHPSLSNVIDAKDFTGSRNGYNDVHGHGTHVTGTVGCTERTIGVASGFKLVHGKGLSDQGSGNDSIVNAMEWCVGRGAKVLSLSLGGGGQSQDWERRFELMAKAGVIIVFAAGNSGPNTPDTDWPGRSEHVLNCAALGQDLNPAPFTNAGDKIDMAWSGVDILSLRPASLGGGYQTMSGTSMATPGSAGELALYLELLTQNSQTWPNVYELREKLKTRAVDVYQPGDDRRTGPGWPSPNMLAFDASPDPFPLGA